MDENVTKDLAERFAQLPKVVRDAITSASVEARLRELADTHKLHLDQWQRLENEVMLVLLGFDAPENMEKNIKNEIGLSDEAAAMLAADISRIIFEPIRAELERELEHPEAKAKEESGVEAARTQMLSENAGPPPLNAAQSAASGEQPALQTVLAATPPPPPILPATPPPPPPTAKAIRMPASGAYKPGEASIARKSVDDDPFRESPA